MSAPKMIGILLIAGGILGLAFGGFSFTKETHQAKVGPLEFSVEEKQAVNIPMWASIVSLVAGAGLLASGFKKA